MWVRKQIDIRWRDLTYGFAHCLLPGSSKHAQSQLEQQWAGGDQSLACLSVRTGWDLFLSAINWPPGSEVLMSAVTIPDMVRVLEAHDFVAVPLDLDPQTAFPTPDSIRKRSTPRTKAVLLAPLFGSFIPIDEHLAVAREIKLQLILDCAQAYRGAAFHGDPRCDVSMFSFGPIKSATALGGALLHVRDPHVLARMREFQSTYPLQSRRSFAIRVAKYAGIKLLSTRLGLRALFALAQLLGRDPDNWLNAAARGFPASELLHALRRQPAYPLLRLLSRRLNRDDEQRRKARSHAGQLLAKQLASNCECPTTNIPEHTFWVFPILVDDPTTVRAHLRAAGFDSSHAHSLRVISPPAGDDRTAPVAEDFVRRLIFLPLDERMPVREQQQMADVVIQAVGGVSPPN